MFLVILSLCSLKNSAGGISLPGKRHLSPPLCFLRPLIVTVPKCMVETKHGDLCHSLCFCLACPSTW
ncbi:hypothetical protein XELAEV_18017520mg [Xenopus laevis]|uniref:Secreted protein n=1 Tax=Xenopus laevis TaxID=8355 RepID=A0A974DDI2_XENLA|nr:hypothetical protein XELAEV_18017520mg [Xenopus laevis]